MAVVAESMRQVEGRDVIEAITAELRILDSLLEALADQRDGIANDDTGAIEAATHAVSRAIFTLDEARRRREWLTRLAGDGSDELRTLENRIGPVPGLDEARGSLRRTAFEVTRNLQLNQMILKRALRSGDRYLQALFASMADTDEEHRVAPTGFLMNRSA